MHRKYCKEEITMAKSIHVKNGDNVIVISGKDKGATGKVIAVDSKKGRVYVEAPTLMPVTSVTSSFRDLRRQKHTVLSPRVSLLRSTTCPAAASPRIS